MDFSTRASGVGRIKENTNQQYVEKFKVIEEARDIRSEEDARLLFVATSEKDTTAGHSGRLLPPLQQKALSFNAEDTFVSRNAQYGIFPVSDFKYFPVRKPDALGWRVGLRSYFRHQQQEKNERSSRGDSPAGSGPKGSEPVEVLERPDTDNNHLRGHKGKQASADAGMNTGAVDGSSTEQYCIRPLALPSQEVTDKYFGDAARSEFYATYRQLKDRGQILAGGYSRLGELLVLPDEQNPLMRSVAVLEEAGAFRETAGGKHVLRNAEQQLGGDQSRDSPQPSRSSVQGRVCQGHGALGAVTEEEDAAPAPSPDRAPSRLDDTSYRDAAMDEHYGRNSPRAMFLAGCLQHKVPPITTALIRKRLSSTVNLARMGLGNKVALLLAPCVAAMPYLQVLNLADNNLQDSGLAALVSSIAAHPHLELLDISLNVIGPRAADALADFIGNPECRLQCLRMSDANIDDGECARFVEVLLRNVHLKELDLSRNLLGKDENLNAVQPDFVTGGESLSALLRHESCPIQILNLHWNMIRLEGAEVLCDSIRANRTLTRLDLSYNALGRSAAQVLGAALMHNNVIREINVAQNGIDAVGCFALCVGARENRSLHYLNLDGNPLGELGGRILVKLAASDGHRLTISAKNCDVVVRSGDVLLDLNDLCRAHEFDLSRSYERACVLELLDTVAMNPAVEFGAFEYCAESRDGPFTALRMSKFVQERTIAPGSREHRERQALESIRTISSVPISQFRATVQKYDTEGSEMVALEDVARILQELRIDCGEDFLGSVKAALDTRGQDAVEAGDLVEFVSRRGAIAADRIRDLGHKVVCCLASEPNRRYLPPSAGVVRVRVVEGYNTGGEFRVAPISHSAVQQVVEAANQSSNPLALLQYSLDGQVLYLEEARMYYQEIAGKTEDSVAALARTLLRMHSAGDAMRLVKSVVGNDVLRLRRLRQVLGAAYCPLVGLYSGFYSLDLSAEQDRACLKRLIEKSVANEARRRQQRQWDTSQLGNWSCFRNELHFAKGSNTPLPDITICPRHFFPMPRSGRVEFDFVNTERPDARSCKPMNEDRLIDCLLISRLLHEDQVDLCISRLAEFSIACRKAFLANGAPHWKAELGRALQVGEHLHGIYTGLGGRRASLDRAAKRELIKSPPPVAEPSAPSPSRADKKRPTDAKVNVRPSMFGKGRQAEPKPMALVMSERQKEMITKFRSVVHRGLNIFSTSPWRRRLFEAMIESAGASDEFRSAAMLEYFESELASAWLYCKHLALVLELFRAVGTAPKSCAGSYRVQLVVLVLDRLLDLHNFELVLMVLSAEEHAAVVARIGLLNLFNPMKPEGGWQLDLSRWEERQAAKMLIHLSVAEPGENWTNKSFIFDRGFAPSPGWDLTVSWLSEEGLPRKGVLSFEMFAGDGMNLAGCLVDPRLRNTLCSLVLVEQRDLLAEIESESMLTAEHNVVFRRGAKAPINYYPDVARPGVHARPTLPLLKLISQSELFPLLNSRPASPPRTLARSPSSGSHPSRKGLDRAAQSSSPALSPTVATTHALLTVDDANAHLARCTDITWSYSSSSSSSAAQRSEPWRLMY